MRMAAALASSGNGKGDDGDNRDKVAAAVNRIVEGLRGDAFDMAMDIGKETLLTEEGISRLIKMIRFVDLSDRGFGGEGALPGWPEAVWTDATARSGIYGVVHFPPETLVEHGQAA